MLVSQGSSKPLLCRLRVGHTRLTHGFLMSGDHQPFCDDCLVPLSVKHLLIECPSSNELRNRHLSECRGEDGSYVLSKVLGEHVGSNDNAVFKYIEDAGYLHQI